MPKYAAREVEKKWQKKWKKTNLYKVNLKEKKRKYRFPHKKAALHNLSSTDLDVLKDIFLLSLSNQLDEKTFEKKKVKFKPVEGNIVLSSFTAAEKHTLWDIGNKSRLYQKYLSGNLGDDIRWLLFGYQRSSDFRPFY